MNSHRPTNGSIAGVATALSTPVSDRVVLNEESEKQLRRKAMMAWGMSSAVVTLMIAVAGYLYLHRAAFDIATN